MGTVEGLFVADKDAVKAAIGEEVYFGEILGKHSEVCGPLEARDIKVITDDPAVVKVFNDYELSSGYNPLSYLQKDQ